MSAEGYDTWILEMRGAGLSTYGMDLGAVKRPPHAMSKQTISSNGTYNLVSQSDELQLVRNFMETFMQLSERLSRFADFQERFSTALKDFQKQLDLIVKCDWDFDHYLEEDVPVAVRWSI